MARLVRVVAPGVPHHVTRRSNRRFRSFFLDDGDVLAYRALLADYCKAAGVTRWAYCLMPNDMGSIDGRVR